MNATLHKNTEPAPASIAQMAKINTLIAAQNPTMEQMQQACRFIPDLLKADLSKVNRYDFCRHIGRELPFKIHTVSETELQIQYGSFYPKLIELYTRKIITNKGWLETLAEKIREQTEFFPKLSGTKTDMFFVVGCCNVEKLESFDLQPANLYEFLVYESWVRQISPLPHVAGKCGYGWLWYTMSPKGVLERVFDAFPGDRSYDEIFRYGERDMPTLVRRIAK